MSAVEQFESTLRELPGLKPPGISGSRIKKLTDIALRNVDSESQLVTKLYTHCKSTPSTHKLGSLYVVDSIVRTYTDEARKSNQTINANAPEGTYAAGAYKISQLIESLLYDALNLIISSDQKEKIGKLVDIWERADTFDPSIIASVRAKHFASTTPQGEPPVTLNNQAPTNATGQTTDRTSNGEAPKDSFSILQALASLAKPDQSQSQPSIPTNTNSPPQLQQLQQQLQQLQQQQQQVPAPQQSQPQPGLPPSLDQQQQIFQMLQQMQAGSIIPQMAQQPRQQQAQPSQFQQFQQQGGDQGHSGGRNDYRDSRRGNKGADDVNGFSRRQRSRSPHGGRYGRRDRDRSPVQRKPLPPTGHVIGEQNIPGTAHYRPKNVSYDNTLPAGSIKVLSRTLFLGGVPHYMDEKELASVLRPFAEVQSVILNSERKHAFVKVYSRAEAEQVITNFNKNGNLGLRTRWGVGFGPRDCCDYQHGVSIIPIARLTDADKLWTVEAQWGGTGGKPLVEGICIDEPDIEIGTGVSSKAISKKMPTNSARNGPKSNKPGEPDENYVKTTLTSNNNTQPSFMQMGGANPLAGLFGSTQQNSAPPPSSDPTALMQSLVANATANNGNNDSSYLGAQMAAFFQQQQNQR